MRLRWERKNELEISQRLLQAGLETTTQNMCEKNMRKTNPVGNIQQICFKKN